MRKIISLFQRNYDGDRLVRDEVVPGAEWVLAGEGVATRKLDGTCCMVRDGKLYKRYEVKVGKTPPANFEPANEVDEVTGKQQGWVPVGDGPEDAWHREAWAREEEVYGTSGHWPPEDGTFELVGPKVQGNPEGFTAHRIIRHGDDLLVWPPVPPRDYEGLKQYLATQDIEGIVWHHPDGRMVKIKKRDFGLPRKPAAPQQP
jgi:hypothetical protein